jgi:hypothetical protein
MKIQVRCLIDNLRAFRKKEEERRLRVCGVVGVGEAVPDQHRADSLNTGWVKVPVKFPALAVVNSERGLGGKPWRSELSTNCIANIKAFETKRIPRYVTVDRTVNLTVP